MGCPCPLRKVKNHWTKRVAAFFRNIFGRGFDSPPPPLDSLVSLARSWQTTNAERVECPERAKRVEGQSNFLPSHCNKVLISTISIVTPSRLEPCLFTFISCVAPMVPSTWATHQTCGDVYPTMPLVMVRVTRPGTLRDGFCIRKNSKRDLKPAKGNDRSRNGRVQRRKPLLPATSRHSTLWRPDGPKSL